MKVCVIPSVRVIEINEINLLGAVPMIDDVEKSGMARQDRIRDESTVRTLFRAEHGALVP